jgi:hypothetical protein
VYESLRLSVASVHRVYCEWNSVVYFSTVEFDAFYSGDFEVRSKEFSVKYAGSMLLIYIVIHLLLYVFS